MADYLVTITSAVGTAAEVGSMRQRDFDAHFDVQRTRVERAFADLGLPVKITQRGQRKAKKLVIDMTFTNKANEVEARKSALYWFSRMCQKLKVKNITGLRDITARAI